MTWACTRPCTWGSRASPWPRRGCLKGLGDTQPEPVAQGSPAPLVSPRARALTRFAHTEPCPFSALTDGKHWLVLTVHARTVAKVPLLVLFQLRRTRQKGLVSVKSLLHVRSLHHPPRLPSLTRSLFSIKIGPQIPQLPSLEPGRLQSSRAISIWSLQTPSCSCFHLPP